MNINSNGKSRFISLKRVAAFDWAKGVLSNAPRFVLGKLILRALLLAFLFSVSRVGHAQIVQRQF
jgi:hypothetical protein